MCHALPRKLTCIYIFPQPSLCFFLTVFTQKAATLLARSNVLVAILFPSFFLHLGPISVVGVKAAGARARRFPWAHFWCRVICGGFLFRPAIKFVKCSVARVEPPERIGVLKEFLKDGWDELCVDNILLFGRIEKGKLGESGEWIFGGGGLSIKPVRCRVSSSEMNIGNMFCETTEEVGSTSDAGP